MTCWKSKKIDKIDEMMKIDFIIFSIFNKSYLESAATQKAAIWQFDCMLVGYSTPK